MMVRGHVGAEVGSRLALEGLSPTLKGNSQHMKRSATSTNVQSYVL